MSLENYTGNISDLVATNPTGTDPRSQGDDHLRGIKYTLKQSFPLATGPVRVSGDKLFAGDSADNTKNFVIDASADNGTMKLARESGQDIMTVDAAGHVAFPQLVTSLGENEGSAALPNGLIVKWGTYFSAADGSFTVTFPAAFPNACAFGIAQNNANVGSTFGITIFFKNAATLIGVVTNNNNGAPTTFSWLAIGY